MRVSSYRDFSLYASLLNGDPREGEEPMSRYILYAASQLSLHRQVRFRKWQWSGFLSHELNMRFQSDTSLAFKNDAAQLKTTLALPLFRSENQLSASVSARSQLWNHYTSTTDTAGISGSSLSSAFLSPGFVTYQAGFRRAFWEAGSIEVGLAAARTNLLVSRRLDQRPALEAAYSLDSGRRAFTELGYSLSVQTGLHELTNRLYLDYSGLFFFPGTHSKAPGVRVDMSHALHYVFLRYLRLTWRSQLMYDPAAPSPRRQLYQELTFGWFSSAHP